VSAKDAICSNAQARRFALEKLVGIKEGNEEKAESWTHNLFLHTPKFLRRSAHINVFSMAFTSKASLP
jgi:hypothetical protein